MVARKRRKRNKAKGGAKAAAAPARLSAAAAAVSAAPPARLAASLGPSPMLGHAPGLGFGNGRLLLLDTRLLTNALGLVAAFWFAWALRELWTTFLFTGVVVFVGAPVVTRLQQRGLPRSAGAGLFLAAGGILLTLLSLLILPALIQDLIALFARLPEAIAALEMKAETEFGVEVPRSLSELSAQVFQELQLNEKLAQSASKALSSGGAVLGKGAGVLLGYVQGAVGAAGRAVFIPVLAFFVLTELPEIGRFLRGLTSQKMTAKSVPILLRINDELSSLVKGQLTVALIMAAIYGVGLWLCNVPLAFGIAILAGLGYLIPFASAPICILLGVTFTVLEVRDGMALPLIGTVVTAVAVQLLEGWVLTPRVVGDSAGLSPLAVVLAVLVAASLFGFIGVLFALPIATAIGVILKQKAAIPA